MPKHSKPRAGSLQFWPRKRARKFLPRVNWRAINSNSKLLGFIGYKVGMASCLVKDNTPDSLTQKKKIIVPCSVIELPPIKIFSVRFYKNNEVVADVLATNIDKELKKKVKLAKQIKKKIEDIEDFDDIRVIVYSVVKKTGIKKTPDLTEVGLGGSKEEKLTFVKERLGKEILASEIFGECKLIDVRGLTTGKGFSGSVKRFGIKLRDHKAEKGRRRIGSVGPWHPAKLNYQVPFPGQLGMFTRVIYNNHVLKIGKVEEDINPAQGWKRYGKIKTEYVILSGSVQGPVKRQLLLTLPLRPNKRQKKLNYEFVGLV